MHFTFLQVDDVWKVGQQALVQRQFIQHVKQVVFGLLCEHLPDVLVGAACVRDGVAQSIRAVWRVQLERLADGLEGISQSLELLPEASEVFANQFRCDVSAASRCRPFFWRTPWRNRCAPPRPEGLGARWESGRWAWNEPRPSRPFPLASSRASTVCHLRTWESVRNPRTETKRGGWSCGPSIK